MKKTNYTAALRTSPATTAPACLKSRTTSTCSAWPVKTPYWAEQIASGIIQPTPLFDQLLEAACDIRPKMIGLDTSSDVYAGEENNRSQVRQFVGLLRKLAIQSNSAVVMCSHPSLTGINSGSGLSGSTGWHNSVRARMYLKPAETDKGDEPDPELRELQFLKNNYGPKAQKILLRWKNGVFIPAQATDRWIEVADQNTERVFLILLGKFNKQLRDVSPKPSKIYAPTLFAADPEAGGIKTKAFERAMSRLLDTNRIHVALEGPPYAAAHALSLVHRTMEPTGHEQARSGTFQRPTNPLPRVPTPYQLGTNPLPTPCVFQPPITPWRWNRPTQGWNPAVLFTPLQGFLRQTRAARAQLIRPLITKPKASNRCPVR